MRIKTERTLTLKEVASYVGADTNYDGKINAICTDSRECEKFDLFVALKGKNYNGADFIPEARCNGAFIMAEREGDVVINNAEHSLLSLSSKYKRLINPKRTIAITGSVGKTTTKEFISSILSSVMSTHKNEANLNNAIGLSKTLLSMSKNTEALVCELGMNHVGEIDLMAKALNPDVAVITNIGTAHIGNLGSRENIAKAKLEIQNGMSDNAITVVSLEEPLLKNVKNPYFISYEDKNADLYAEILSLSSEGGSIFVKTKNFELVSETKLYSEHTINSLINAISVCDILNLAPEKISEAIKGITPSDLRQKFIFENRYTIYDDSYNSSPEAVIATLKTLAKLGRNNAALLGDMLELGEKSEEMHLMIGAECVRQGFKKLYAFGNFSETIARGARNFGMDEKFIFINPDLSKPEITAEHIIKSYEGETLLVKASHSVRADRIINLLTKKEPKNA